MKFFQKKHVGKVAAFATAALISLNLFFPKAILSQQGINPSGKTNLVNFRNSADRLKTLIFGAIMFDGQGNPQGLDWLAVNFLFSIKDAGKYFTSESLGKFRELVANLRNTNIEEQGEAVRKWHGENGNACVRFKSPQSFFEFYRDIGRNLDEGEKVRTISQWAGFLKEKFDNGVGKEPVGAEKVIERFIEGKNVGMCGQINGVFAKKLADGFGLSHATVSAWPRDSKNGHLVALVRGEKGYYIIDYSDVRYVGKTANDAAEGLFSHFGSYRPFAFSSDRRGVFYSPPLEKRLLSLMNWGEGIFGSYSLQAWHGFMSARAQASVGGKRANVGAFAMASSSTLGNVFGAYFNFRSGMFWRGSFSSSLDVGFYYSSTTNGFAIMSNICPVSISLSSGNVSISANPARFELAYGGRTLYAKRITTRVMASFAKGGNRFYVFSDAAHCNTDLAYQFGLFQSFRHGIGIMVGNSLVEARVVPNSLLAWLEIDASHTFSLGNGLSLSTFISAENSFSWHLQGGVNLSYGK